MIDKCIKIIGAVILTIICVFLIICMSIKFSQKIEVERIENQINKNDIEKVSVLLDNDILGIITIDKINLKAIVKDGIDDDTLNNYIGHFTNTSIFNGNVGLAGHNNGFKNNYFKSIHLLEKGDIITYKTNTGILEYVVDLKVIIDEENWEYLRDTEDNKITLITCINGSQTKRLCIQATENITKTQKNI